MATVHIDEKIPARILRGADPAGEPQLLCDLIARRFMGVLVHPVPPTEMQEQVGAFRPGGKIFVNWPADRRGWYAAGPGDQIEFEGNTLTILAMEDYPFCYGEIYVDKS